MPCVIGIAGRSGSGKTELARRLAGILAAPVISLDRYYRDLAHLSLEERCGTNFDVPDAIDHELLSAQLALFTRGVPVDLPVYDFTRHVRDTGVEPVQIGQYAILEGLFALYWNDVRSLLSTRVFVETPDEICCQRRLVRDVRERGRSLESVLVQYTRTVRPMAELYIQPTRRYADVVVSGTVDLDQEAAAVLDHIGLVCGYAPEPAL